MNETEKRAFGILGEKMKEQIAGGVKEDEALTNEQCAELNEAISQLSKEDQLKIAGGKSEKESDDSVVDKELQKLHLFPVAKYGMPNPEKYLLKEIEQKEQDNHEE